jgi:hypothetical protein
MPKDAAQKAALISGIQRETFAGPIVGVFHLMTARNRNLRQDRRRKPAFGNRQCGWAEKGGVGLSNSKLDVCGSKRGRIPPHGRPQSQLENISNAKRQHRG